MLSSAGGSCEQISLCILFLTSNPCICIRVTSDPNSNTLDYNSDANVAAATARQDNPQPPLTGGMTATVSPPCKRVDTTSSEVTISSSTLHWLV